MGSIGAPELVVLALLGLSFYFVVSRVRRIAARGAARIARQEEEREARRIGAAAPRVEKRVERHVEREKIIERQVVVMHCRFCKELTPVDLSDCKSCGARLK